MVGSVICFSTMDLIVKYLNEVPFGQVLFMRFFFGMIPIFFLIPRDKIFTFYKTKRPGLHTFRAVSGTIAIIALFIGLRNFFALIITLVLFSLLMAVFALPSFYHALHYIIEKYKAQNWKIKKKFN